MRRIALLLILFIKVPAVQAQERHIMTSDSVSLYVNVKGNGPACLYIHGGPGSGSYWLEKLYGATLEQHFQMVYLDQRGVARSSSPKDHNYSMDRMAKDFEEVRKALGIRQWLTLGHSFGGVLQMGYVKHFPEAHKGMLMINCTLGVEESLQKSWIPKAYEFVGIEYSGSGDTLSVFDRLMDAANKLNEKGVKWKMAYADHENEEIMNATFNEIPNWNNDFSSVALTMEEYMKDYRQHTSEIDIPVLFFYGKTDWSVGPEHYKEVRFRNMILWGSDVGHMPFQENKKDLEKAIKKYMTKNKFL